MQMSSQNSGATTPIAVNGDVMNMRGELKGQGTKSRRSVSNMNPIALEKKRENDRNAQRNIREKARNNLAALEHKVKELEANQDPELKRALAEAQNRLKGFQQLENQVKALTALLLQHGIDPNQALPPTQEQFGNVLGEMEMGRPTTSYQGVELSPAVRSMYPIGQVQSQPLALVPIQYNVDSPQHMGSHIDSPQSLGLSHHSGSHMDSPQSLRLSNRSGSQTGSRLGSRTGSHYGSHQGSPQLTESPQFTGNPLFTGPSQHMEHLQQTGPPQTMLAYPQSIPSQFVEPSQHMGQTHPMAQSQSMPPQFVGPPQHMRQAHPMVHSQSQSSPLQHNFQNLASQNAYPSNQNVNWNFQSPNNAQGWDHANDVALPNGAMNYPTDVTYVPL
ncbi:hypothetical protein SBOR_5569 [Sclerotinia borealis F-4128]|uniref:BZIP domain-containing protein n=1 Tax=Sclerotinia borealis (strain F-4128) TaxID=1432307 RepID=W9CDX0_SCLBF|nr:hypothetical protein SBOR_5569 [Sclerotinia borealis F-4128]